MKKRLRSKGSALNKIDLENLAEELKVNDASKTNIGVLQFL